jgi:hypothetical protein
MILSRYMSRTVDTGDRVSRDGTEFFVTVDSEEGFWRKGRWSDKRPPTGEFGAATMHVCNRT